VCEHDLFLQESHAITGKLCDADAVYFDRGQELFVSKVLFETFSGR